MIEIKIYCKALRRSNTCWSCVSSLCFFFELPIVECKSHLISLIYFFYSISLPVHCIRLSIWLAAASIFTHIKQWQSLCLSLWKWVYFAFNWQSKFEILLKCISLTLFSVCGLRFKPGTAFWGGAALGCTGYLVGNSTLVRRENRQKKTTLSIEHCLDIENACFTKK